MDWRRPKEKDSVLLVLEDTHLSDEALEQYHLGMLKDERDVAIVEEHLLFCAHCQDRLEQVENFVAAFREGARKVEQDPPKSGGGKPWQLMAVAAVAAGLAAVFVLPRWGGADATPVAISLASYRDQAGMTGPAGKPLRLKLDVEGLEGERFGYRVVSEGRELVAEGSLARGRAEIVVRGLEAGKYWVRVTEGSGGGLLREYGLEIR